QTEIWSTDLSFTVCPSSLERGEIDIDVLLALNLGETLAQLVDVGARRHGERGFELEQRRAAYRRRIGFGFHGFNVDAEIAQNSADLVNDTGMIHARRGELVRKREVA